MSLVLQVAGACDRDLSRYKHSIAHTAAIIGNGVYYNGGTAFYDMGSAFQATFRSSFSIGLWFKSDDGQPAAQGYLLGSVNPAIEDLIQVYVKTTGYIDFQYKSNNNLAFAGSNAALLSNGQEWWHRLWCVADSTVAGVGGLVMYLDGDVVTLDGTNDGDTSGVTFADYTSATNLYAGSRNYGGTNSPHACFQDDFRIYNTAISASYAKDDYRNSISNYRNI